MKKCFNIAVLLAFVPSSAYAACNADNVLRALQANAPKASPFCSTYTLPPPNQPLPTYVSQYPASRVSSGCSCLITTGPTTLTTSTTATTATTSTTSLSSTSTTPSATPTSLPTYQCDGELVRNGGFQTISSSGGAPPWEFAQPVNPNSGQESRASLIIGADGNNLANLTVKNPPAGGYGSTYITQPIPGLCKYDTYTLTFNADTRIYDQGTGKGCTLEINVAGAQLVYIAPGPSSIYPYEYRKRTYIYQYGGCGPYGEGCAAPNVLTVRFTCAAPFGTFGIDNISFIGGGQ